jgi:hypothetical protein
MVKCLKEVIIIIIISLQAVRMFYHAYIQFPMKYSIIFWLADHYIDIYCCTHKGIDLSKSTMLIKLQNPLKFNIYQYKKLSPQFEF